MTQWSSFTLSIFEKCKHPAPRITRSINLWRFVKNGMQLLRSTPIKARTDAFRKMFLVMWFKKMVYFILKKKAFSSLPVPLEHWNKQLFKVKCDLNIFNNLRIWVSVRKKLIICTNFQIWNLKRNAKIVCLIVQK